MRNYQHLFTNDSVDAVIVISEKNRRYFTQFASSLGYLVLLPNKCLFLTDARYYEMAQCLQKDGIEVVQIGRGNTMALIIEYLSANGVKRIGYEDTELTVQLFNDISNALVDYQLVPCGQAINKIRQTKDSEEINYIKYAQKITDTSFNDILKFIKPGMTEIDVSVELMYRLHKNGGDGLAFETIVASGTNTSMPHAHPTNKVIKKGDAITLDFGASYNGYCSDMTRTFFVGEPSEEMRKIYNVVLEAQKNVLDNAYVGITGSELDSLAREVIMANGYGEYFTHSTGHSLGIDIHESPSASANCSDIFTENMLVTVEPGIYIPNLGGVRIEDMILFSEHGVINLTSSPKNIIII